MNTPGASGPERAMARSATTGSAASLEVVSSLGDYRRLRGRLARLQDRVTELEALLCEVAIAFERVAERDAAAEADPVRHAARAYRERRDIGHAALRHLRGDQLFGG
ncbi:MAG: hypothetical protein JSR54_14650 [Proteobacteria bacterium]|nr:hypothetical protein [Pseudomonadota bacterium]